MSSIKVCLDRIPFAEREKIDINNRVRDYREEGYEAHQAAVSAAKDWIKQLEDERAAIEKQISDFFGAEYDSKRPALVLHGERPMPKGQAEMRTKGKKQAEAEQGAIEFAPPPTPERIELQGEKAGPKDVEGFKKAVSPHFNKDSKVGDVVGSEKTGFWEIVERQITQKAQAKETAEKVGGEVFIDYDLGTTSTWGVWKKAEKPAAATPAPAKPILDPKAQIKGRAERNVAKLLHQLGIQSEILQGDAFHLRIKREPYMDLVIERHPDEKGRPTIYLTHYIHDEASGDTWIDSEMVYVVSEGYLILKEVAVQNPIQGGELRKFDRSFANVFSKNLLAQGFGTRWQSQERKLEEQAEKQAEAPAEPKPAGPNYDQIRAELEKEGVVIAPGGIHYAIEKTIADEWQYVKSYPSGLVVRSRTEETPARVVNSVIDDIERDAKLDAGKTAAPADLQKSRELAILDAVENAVLSRNTIARNFNLPSAEAVEAAYQAAVKLHGTREQRLRNRLLGIAEQAGGMLPRSEFFGTFPSGRTTEIARALKQLVDDGYFKTEQVTNGTLYTLLEPVAQKPAPEAEPAEKPYDVYKKSYEERIMAYIKRAGYSASEQAVLDSVSGITRGDIVAALARLVEDGQLVIVNRGRNEVYEIPEDNIPRGPRETAATQQLAKWVAHKVKEKEAFTWRELFDAADKRFGGTQAEGKYTVKDAYDAMELGINFAIDNSWMTLSPNADPKSAAEIVKNLKKMLELVPTQTKRTQEQQDFQQFSTPPPLAYVVNWVLNLQDGDVYLEPSAGIGGIAVFAMNSNLDAIYANELSPRRAAILGWFEFTKVYTENAEQLNNILPDNVKPTVIGMNPPFSSTAGRVKTNDTKYGARHIEQALARLQPGGRLVAIVGRGMAESAPTFKEWWKRIKARYNVLANISINGEEYKKYGTTFDNQILVIDKTGPTIYDTLVGKAEKLEDLIPLLEGVRNARPQIPAEGSQRPSIQPSLPATPQSPESAGGPGLPVPGATPGMGGGEQPSGPPIGNSGVDSEVLRNPPEAAGGGMEAGPAETEGRPGGRRPADGGRNQGPDLGDQPGGSGLDDVIKGLLELSAQEAEKVSGKEAAPAPPKPTPAPGLTPSQKEVAKTKAEDGQAKVDAAVKKFNDLFASVKKDTIVENQAEPGIDPAKWPAVHEALKEMWLGFKDMVSSIQEAAKLFIRDAYTKLSAKGRAYIDKFIREDIRADLEAEQKIQQQTTLPKEIDYTQQGQNRVESQQEIEDSLFSDYRPKVKIEGAQPHPSRLVQSVAMADTDLPEARYKTLIPIGLIKSGNISEAQLEAVIYSNQSFEVIFPDGTRRGFFIGDGTGVGKGREIAAIIYENYLRGRKKAVWISEKPDLMGDASRDLYGEVIDEKTGKATITGIGWKKGAELLFKAPGRKNDQQLPITKQEGILFMSYAALRQGLQEYRSDRRGTENNLDIKINLIADWLGPDFDGVIAFDESHNMRNASAVQGSRGKSKAAEQALAGIELQKRFPKARILYVSATGAVEVENLVYAERLGLWGEGTAFSSVNNFLQALLRAGMAGMEMIARDLKSRALYISRSLSYHDVEYDRMLHTLDEKQVGIYNELARAWQIIFQNVNEVEREHTGGKKRNTWSVFWGSQQRFFESVVTAMQMPSVLKSAEADLAAGHSVIFQLTKTGNATATRAEANMQEGDEYEDLDLSPKETLIKFLMTYFPVQQYEPVTDEHGNTRMQPVVDSNGNPVLNAEAVARRDELVVRIGSIQGIPASPLDMIVQHFGQDNTAEVTSRPFRFVYGDDGKLKKETWSKAKSVKDAATFMDDKKRVLVFSEAGGTGASYHASLDKKNQRKRIHYMLQSGWNAVRAVQGLGRSHRSHQKQAPKFWLVTTNIKGQARFISTIARRLDQIGALTKGQRQAGSQGIFQARDNLENQYAREAFLRFLLDLQAGAIEGLDPHDFQNKTGIKLFEEDRATGEHRVPTQANSWPDVPRFLNRALALELHEQDKVFDEFFDRIDQVITRHAEAGTLDVGIETISGISVVNAAEQVVHVDPLTGATTKYVRVEATKHTAHIPYKDSGKIYRYPEGTGPVYYRNVHSKRIWVASHQRSRPKDGQVELYRTLRGPAENAYQNLPNDVLSDPKKWEIVPDDGTAEGAWSAEYRNLAPTRVETHHLLTGALLPIWDRLEGDTRIYRTVTDQGERLLGRVIPQAQLESTLGNLGVGVALKEYSGEEVHRLLMNRSSVTLVNGWKLKNVTLSGDDRIELVGPGYYDYNMMGEFGVFTEVVQYKTRFFVPTSEKGVEVISRLIKNKPVKTVEQPYSGPVLASVKTWNEIQEPKTQYQQAFEFGESFEGQPQGGIPNLIKATSKVRMQTTGHLKAGTAKIRGPAEAASFLAHIRKHAQENMYVAVTDATGNVIEIHRYGKGTKNAASAYPWEVVGYVLNVPGARHAYIAHNHPSLDTTPSAEDMALMGLIRAGLNLANIRTTAIVVGGTKWRTIGTKDPLLPYQDAAKIPPAKRKKKFAIKERLLATNRPGPAINNSASAVAIKNDLFGDQREGWMLVNTKNQVIGFFEYPKGKSKRKASVDFIRAVERTNAAAGIFFQNDPLSSNDKKIDSRMEWIRDLNAASGLTFTVHDILSAGKSYRDQFGDTSPIRVNYNPEEGYSQLNRDDLLLSIKRPVPDNPDFNAWFEDSKVVEANGDPKVVFHGTMAVEFDSFETAPVNHLARSTPLDPIAYLGTHFAVEPEVANLFAAGVAGTPSARGRVIPAYIRIRNPYVTTESGLETEVRRAPLGHPVLKEFVSTLKFSGPMEKRIHSARVESEKEFWRRYKKDPEFRREVFADLSEYVDEGEFMEIASDAADNFRMELIQKFGHDGIQYENETEGGTSWIVFNPDQVKSVFSRKFDPRATEILASVKKDPVFNSTDEAIAYGKKATPEQVEQLYALYEDTKGLVARMMKSANMEDLDEALKLATVAQFYREAYEAAKGENDLAVRQVQEWMKRAAEQDILASVKTSDSPWYSQLEEHLVAKLPGSGTPEQFKNLIAGWAKSGAIKQEEVAWTGILESLEESKAEKITKGEVLEMLDSVIVNEVLRGIEKKGLTKAQIIDAWDELGYEPIWEGESDREDDDTFAGIGDYDEEAIALHNELAGGEGALDAEERRQEQEDIVDRLEEHGFEIQWSGDGYGEGSPISVTGADGMVYSMDSVYNDPGVLDDMLDTLTPAQADLIRALADVYSNEFTPEEAPAFDREETFVPAAGENRFLTGLRDRSTGVEHDRTDSWGDNEAETLLDAWVDLEDAQGPALRPSYMEEAVVTLRATKHHAWQEPGGENYRELLFQLPAKASKKLPPVDTSKWRIETIDKNEWTGQREIRIMSGVIELSHRYGFRGTDEEAMADMVADMEKFQQKVLNRKRFFTSSHWEEENVLAWVRFNERMDMDGKKVLFIEEIQSDWHQKARKLRKAEIKRISEERKISIKEATKLVPIDYGYSKELTKDDAIKMGYSVYSAKSNLGKKAFFMRGPSNRRDIPATGWDTEKEAWDGVLEFIKEKAESEIVPDAPFKTSWQLLAIKRMVRWAAENGFDSIAWTTGAMQVKRYEDEFRRAVDAIVWEDTGATHLVRAHKGGAVVFEEFFTPDGKSFNILKGERRTLDEVLGKDIANQILTGTGKAANAKTAKWEGPDLTIGGEGMKGAYDVMLPAEINKFFNKAVWGNAKVQKIGINFGKKRGIYEGPSVTRSQVVEQTDSMKQTYQINDQLKKIAQAMIGPDEDTAGMSWEEAVSTHGSIAVAELFGGKLEWVNAADEVLSLPVTDAMRQRASEKGMPLFSVKRMSPVARTYLDALKAAIPDQFIETEKDLDADPFDGLSAETKKRLGAARGVPVPKLLQKAKIAGTGIWHSMTRHRPFLDPEKEANIADILRTHQDTPDNSIRRALQVLHGIVGGMKPKQYQVFSLKLLMDDMIRDIESGLLSAKTELPFGFTEDEAYQYRDYLTDLADNDAVISEAIGRRQRFQGKLKYALVEADLLPKSVLDDDRYFHHQVLKYRALAAAGEAYEGLSVGSKDVRLKKKGWQMARVGSIEDYNTEYVQAEFEVIAQGLAQLETRHVMDKIKALADITENLKARAKQMNYDRFYEIEAARQSVPGSPPLTPDDIRDTDHDPLKPYKVSIAIGMSGLRKMAKKGQLQVGQEWNDVVQDLAGQTGPTNIRMLEQGRIFAFLNYLLNNNLPGAPKAGMIFKAIQERNQHIKGTLGRKFVTPSGIMPDGYTEWKPAPGKSWYKAYSLTDRLVAAVQAGEVVIGKENADKIQQVLARGRDAVWIIPKDVAKTLDGFDQVYEDHLLSKASRAAMNAWKKWILINPYRVIKYNLNNLSGDLDIAFAYAPAIITHHLPMAVKDLTTELRGKKKLPPALQKELDLAHTLGVLDSGWAMQEVSEVAGNLALFEHMEALQGNKPHLISRAWRNLKEYTRYRENWLRLAAFRYFREQIRKGNAVYGASNQLEVDGLTDPDRKAAKLARELIGDYGNITHAGQFIRRHLIPFYAWMEINAPRYVRLMRNLKHEGRGGNARLSAVFGKNIAWKATKLGAKMAGFFVLVNLWNMTFFPDEEDELGESARRQLHLILGRNPDGSIRTLRIQGAFSDALSWFGAEDIVQDVRAYRAGRKSLADIATDSALATPIRIINALRPDVKMIGEAIGGQAWYPDPFNPRPIRDKIEHVARTFSLDHAYRWLAGKPKRGDSTGKQLVNDLMALGFYNADPGESAYYDTLKQVSEYREKQGKDQPGIVPTDKSNALYYYKQGLKYGDLAAAERYLRRYFAMGGTEQGLAQSIKRIHPLGSLAQKDWRDFVATLSPQEKETFQRAVDWYNRTYQGQPAGQVKAGAMRPEKQAPPAAGSGLTLREAVQMMQ